jgi:hypothetical protein
MPSIADAATVTDLMSAAEECWASAWQEVSTLVDETLGTRVVLDAADIARSGGDSWQVGRTGHRSVCTGQCLRDQARRSAARRPTAGGV